MIMNFLHSVAPLLIEGLAGQVIRVTRSVQSFSLECSVRAEPPPRLVVARNGVELFDPFISVDFTSPNLAPLTFNDSGNYTCVANNTFGSIHYSFSVIVQGKCTLDTSESINVSCFTMF